VDFRLGAKAIGCDIDKRVLTCQSVLGDSKTSSIIADPDDKFSINYDKIIIGVGALSNTFGVKGVLEHALFLKVGRNI